MTRTLVHRLIPADRGDWPVRAPDDQRPLSLLSFLVTSLPDVWQTTCHGSSILERMFDTPGPTRYWPGWPTRSGA